MHDARKQKKKKDARIKGNKLPSTCLKHEIKNWFPSIGPNKLNENHNNQKKLKKLRLLKQMQIQQRKLKIPECSVEFNTSDMVEFSQFDCLSSLALAKLAKQLVMSTKLKSSK